MSTKLADYMAATGSTQEQIAERIGVTRQAVSLYLLGRATPGLEIALKMRDMLGVHLDTWKKRKAVKR